eukprot:CAMPEP_0181109138 /NCGR_PEP_ID=MMETSP1071-20121207/18013_1 /TAXON_ID=35127 /ORGANISM="Thalassiosira sp., Strain NH16" /LENGTH=376 /DNA_ID=CAMNT_0023192807 /DNA_START=56 /DNA_END=1186 /DNA_ORIENTATION=-
MIFSRLNYQAVVVLSIVGAICGAMIAIAFFSVSSINNLRDTSVGEPSHLQTPSSDHIHLGSNRRRLSKALPNGGCRLTFPEKPNPGTPITYAASYPGCGARMSWNLVEALTGLHSGDDWNNNGRGSEVVTVKTHYPQSNGVLPEFDHIINRVFIVIRNPIKSIPSFFNHIYEMRNHLPVHSTRAPVEEWVRWRNAYLDTEIEEYKKFIIYWMDRYTPENRHVLAYEELTDDVRGAVVTENLNNFLGRVEGVIPIATESVPCIWRAVVKNIPPPQQAAHIQHLQKLANNNLLAEANERTEPGIRRRLNPGHFDSQRKGPQPRRPYTIDQLDKMMSMLLEVAHRYEKEHVQLFNVMMGYYEEIKDKKNQQLSRNPPGG